MGFIKSSSKQELGASILVKETFTHSIAFGQTGCGKTTSFIYPNLQNRLSLGHGILLYDYKGKEHASVKYLAEKAGRLEDVLEIGKPWGESINLVENMDEEELDVFFDNILKHGDDNKFWQNSAKSLGQSVLKVLKAIEGFAREMALADESFEKENPKFIKSGKYKFPTKRTLASMIGVCNTFENLGKFIEGMGTLEKTANATIAKIVKDMMSEEGDADKGRAVCVDLVKARERLTQAIKETADSLENFGKDSNENLTQNVIGSLVSPLLSLAQNAFFNAGSFDVASALNEGKIVVINAEALSDAALESLNNVILRELSKRTRSVSVEPISVFIDEAQRVLSETTDLPIDVLREAKVDVFLSTQNSALLKHRLSEEKFDALMGNLTRKFYFKNSFAEDIDTLHHLNLLETFEYVSGEDNFETRQTSEPVYIQTGEKLRVESAYQKERKVLLKYAYSHHKKPFVLEYVSRLYKDKKLLAINTKTMKETVIDSDSYTSIKYVDYQVEAIFRQAADELGQERDYDRERDVDDDFDLEIAS